MCNWNTDIACGSDSWTGHSLFTATCRIVMFSMQNATGYVCKIVVCWGRSDLHGPLASNDMYSSCMVINSKVAVHTSSFSL